MVSKGSEKKVWWICDKGHEWQSAPYNIAKGNYCPYCANRMVLKGFNDLESVNPKIAKEWNYKRNNIVPSEVIFSSTKKVWWICSKGHEWQAVIYSRNQNHACPICNLNKVTSLPEKAIAFYLLKSGIHIEENSKIIGKKEVDIYMPDRKIAIEYDGQYYHKDKERDLLKNRLCSDAGITLFRIREPGLPKLDDGLSVNYEIGPLKNDYSHLADAIEWLFSQLEIKSQKINIAEQMQEIAIFFDKQKSEKSITVTDPEVSKEWDYAKNLVDISTVTRGSYLDAYWKCEACGYEWRQKVCNRCTGKGCPKMLFFKDNTWFNDLATTHEYLLKEWNYDKNKISPAQIGKGSNQKVLWICGKNHEWMASPHNRAKGNGCPICANRIVLRGFNDLSSREPTLVAEWDYEQNAPINPCEALFRSTKSVYWKCPQCGYLFAKSPLQRRMPPKCPNCKNNPVNIDSGKPRK